MKYFIALLLLGAISISVGWVVPEDLPDGIWHITLPIDGDNTTKPTLHKRGDISGDIDSVDIVANPPPIIKPPEPILPVNKHPFKGRQAKMPVSNFDCIFYEPHLYHTAYEIARNNLFSYCREYMVPAKTAHIAAAKSGDVIAYVCSWSRRARRCSEFEYRFVERWYMDTKCGKLTPAWVASTRKKRSYGRAWIGSDICQTDLYGRSKKNLKKHYWIGRPGDDDDTHLGPEWEKSEPKTSKQDEIPTIEWWDILPPNGTFQENITEIRTAKPVFNTGIYKK